MKIRKYLVKAYHIVPQRKYNPHIEALCRRRGREPTNKIPLLFFAGQIRLENDVGVTRRNAA